MQPKPLDLSTVQIPTLPEVVMKLTSMVDNPLVGLLEIGQTVRQDASMATRLLRLANSASFGLQEPVLSVEQAAAALGTRTLRNLAMQAAVIDLFEDLPSTENFDIQLVWRHAILTAQTSQAIATEVRKNLTLAPDEFYSCGLVHDVGKLVLLQALGEDYLEVMHDARKLGQASHLAEQAALGYTHYDIGARVAKHWGLPPALIDAIQYHHGPVSRIRDDRSIAVIAIADQIAYRVQCGATESCAALLGPKAEQLLGLRLESFDRVLQQAIDLWPTIRL